MGRASLVRSSLLDDLTAPWLPREASGAEKFFRAVPTLVYMGAIHYVSSLPAAVLPIPPYADDRALHFAVYFGLGILLMFTAAAFATGRRSARAYLPCAAIGVWYGAIDEWHQSFVPGRDPSMIDWIFDAGGVASAVVLIHLLLRRRARS
jgi:VanZ family protein